MHDQVADNLVEVIALILLPLAVLMCAYALTVFVWRSRAIAKKTVRYPTPCSQCAGSWILGVVFTAVRVGQPGQQGRNETITRLVLKNAVLYIIVVIC